MTIKKLMPKFLFFGILSIVGLQCPIANASSNEDTTPPYMLILEKENLNENTVVLSISAKDDKSGISHIELPNGQIINRDRTEFQVEKTGTYNFKAVDNSGNERLIKVVDLDFEVYIPDDNLFKSMNKVLGRSNLTAPILRSELKRVTRLSSTGGDFVGQVHNLTGLQYLDNLTNLVLSYIGSTKIDLSPISNLTKLTEIDIRGRAVESLEPFKKLDLTILKLEGTSIDDSFMLNENLSHMTNLTTLWINNNKISDISFLSNMSELVELRAESNQIEDLEPLRNLTKIQGVLRINNNKVSNIEPILNLTKVTHLFLNSNQIEDIDNIDNLSKLIQLNLSSNKITNMPDLKSLTTLTNLSLSENKLLDMTGLKDLINLKYLYLDNTGISDISSIENLTNLIELYLSGNNLSNISLLKKLTKLNTLSLNTNQIVNISNLKYLTELKTLSLYSNQISDISPLKDLVNLKDLRLNNNNIQDISSIKDLINLETLYLHNNEIVEVLDLKKLTKLKYLYMYNNQITDVSGLEGLVSLNDLRLQSNQITDINIIEDLVGLNRLELQTNNIYEIPILDKLINLTYLDLSYNNISDICSLSGLIKLTNLNMGKNNINDVSPLSNLTTLTTLNLYQNNIADISSLKKLTNLNTLSLYSNQIEDISVVRNFKNLTSLQLYYNRIYDISVLGSLPKLNTLTVHGQAATINGVSEIGKNFNTSFKNPIRGINGRGATITSIPNNGYYKDDKIYLDNISLGKHSFNISFNQLYTVGGKTVTYSGSANINLEIVDGSGPDISNDSYVEQDELNIYLTITAEDIHSDVDYLIHKGEKHSIPYSFKYDNKNNLNNMVEVFDELGNSSIYEVVPDKISVVTIQEYIDLLKNSNSNNTVENIDYIRGIINKMSESSNKDLLSDKVNNLFSNITLEKKVSTANLDIYIKSENMLSMSLDTNSVTFDNYSGVEPAELKGATTLSISSSLPYDIKAYMPSNISNADGSETINMQFFNIKEGSIEGYQQFIDNTTALVLKADCPSATEATTHKIDMKLDFNESHTPDIYKTVIKFEVEQK